MTTVGERKNVWKSCLICMCSKIKMWHKLYHTGGILLYFFSLFSLYVWEPRKMGRRVKRKKSTWNQWELSLYCKLYENLVNQGMGTKSGFNINIRNVKILRKGQEMSQQSKNFQCFEIYNKFFQSVYSLHNS